MKEHSESSLNSGNIKGMKTAGLRISVFGNDGAIPSSFTDASRIAVFEKQDGAWVNRQTHSLPGMDCTSPAKVRAWAEKILSLIGDSGAVAAACVSGIAYSVFDGAGKHIFEIQEISDEQLSGIAEDIALAEAKKALDAQAFSAAEPKESESQGIFHLDLIKVSGQFPELSSKIIIKPFLQKGQFKKLVITCAHFPFWLDNENAFHITREQSGDHVIVTVDNKAVIT